MLLRALVETWYLDQAASTGSEPLNWLSSFIEREDPDLQLAPSGLSITSGADHSHTWTTPLAMPTAQPASGALTITVCKNGADTAVVVTVPASGTLTITIRKNGTDTAVMATVPVSGAAGTYSSSTSVTVAAGDVITIKFVNAATAVSAAVKGVTLELAIA
jgi:hypothetical protein